MTLVPRPFPLPSIYLIAEQATCGERPILEVLDEALEGGVRLVQLREKEMGREALRVLAAEVRKLTSQAGARLLINSDVGVAESVRADGVHLPSSLIPQVNRAELEPCLIGASTHNQGELTTATDIGADFVTFSPVYASASKLLQGRPTGVDELRRFAEQASMPVYALSGITPERVGECREAGAAGVAVMGGILRAKDVRKAVEAYSYAWNG